MNNNQSSSISRFVFQLYLWAKNVGESFLALNAGMGDDGDAIEDFVAKHETLRSETEVCGLLVGIRVDLKCIHDYAARESAKKFNPPPPRIESIEERKKRMYCLRNMIISFV